MLPDLSGAKVISLDIETKDPELKNKGPGVYRKDGYICGVGIATDDGLAEYYDLAHPGPKEHDPDKVVAWLRETLARPVPILGANLLYDLDWLCNGVDQDGKPYGIKIGGKIHDVQAAEPLIDGLTPSVKLDALAEKYLGKHKEIDGIAEICKQNGWKGDPRKHIYKMQASKVREYGLSDVLLPIEIFRKQWAEMYNQDLLDLYHIETGLYPLLLKMRRTGVRIDLNKVDELEERLTDDYKQAISYLSRAAGREVNTSAPADVKKLLTEQGIPIPIKTETKAGQIKRRETTETPALEQIDHPICQAIIRVRKARNAVDKFLNKYIKDNLIGDRLHTGFHPLRSDEYGAVTGRFSASTPPLQQIPVRDPVYGKPFRELFIPEDGHGWNKTDYASIEPRINVHVAELIKAPGIGPIADGYRDPAGFDMYVHMAPGIIGTNDKDTIMSWRKKLKSIVLGINYGMGKAKLCNQLGVEIGEGEQILAAFNHVAPWVKYTAKAIQRKAERRGYVKTILGRRQRFPDRNYAYKAANAYMQGSSADMIKKAMLDLYQAGVYDILCPHLTVHDELDDSFPLTKEGAEAVLEKKRIMEDAVKLSVPVIADAEIGSSWGDLTGVETIEDFRGILCGVIAQ